MHVEVTGDVRAKSAEQYTRVGRSVARVDLPGKVFAQPSYIQDVRLPGMLHARVVRPQSQAHSLERIEQNTVASLPGVRAVVRDGSFLAVVADREEQAIAAAGRLRKSAVWKQSQEVNTGDSPHELRRSRTDDTVVHRTGAGTGGAVRGLVADYSRPFIAHASMSPSAACSATACR